VKTIQKNVPCFFLQLFWLKRKLDSTAIACANFPPKSFHIRKLCDGKVVAKNAGHRG
jgi:hypothetical protein